MIYTLILNAIYLFSNSFIVMSKFKNNIVTTYCIEEGLNEDYNFDTNITDYYITQEQLDLLV
jgi:hypothetical protein